MSVIAELAKPGAVIEFGLLIEGIGWWVDDQDFSKGIDGRVFVSNDINGDFASQLDGSAGTASIHKGLRVSGGIEATIDTIGMEYNPGSMSFSIDESDDDWLLTNFAPTLNTILDGKLNVALNQNDTTIAMTNGAALGSSLTEIWVGGRELVRLGSHVSTAADVVTYNISTATNARGYKGTPRGPVDFRSQGDMSWAQGSLVTTGNQFWRGRRVCCFMHVPGEGVSDVRTIYWGRFTNAQVPDSGRRWRISTSAMQRPRCNPIRTTGSLKVYSDDFGYQVDGQFTGINLTELDSSYALANSIRRVLQLTTKGNVVINGIEGYTPEVEQAAHLAIREAYQYRTEPGGTNGITGQQDLFSIQALDTGADDDVAMTLVQVGDNVMRLIKRQNTYQDFFAEPAYPQTVQTLTEQGTEAKLLLDNWLNDYTLSRFALDRVVTRNVIDVALMFLLSCPGEFWRADATGGTATVPTFSSVGTADKWIGYTLHCVEGDNKGYSRPITDNTTTSITVDPPFPNTPGVGDEYQIRNSPFDVLPFSWGMGMRWQDVDTDQWLALRDERFSEFELSKFAIGGEEQVDLWDLVAEKILKPWGLVPYMSPVTGRLSLRYIGEALETAVFDTYPTISESQIAAIGGLDFQIQSPVGRITLELAPSTEAVTAIGPPLKWQKRYGLVEGRNGIGLGNAIAYGAKGKATVVLEPDGIAAAFDKDAYETLSFEAPLIAIEDAEELIAENIARLERHSRGIPTVNIKVQYDAAFQLDAGDIVSVTDSRLLDLFAGDRGISSVACRIISISKPTMGGEYLIDLTLQILEDVAGGLVAPAADVSSEGSDGFGYYMVVSDEVYTNDRSVKDWYGFAVNDYIQFRDIHGAKKGSAVQITAFGSNQSSTPEGASDSRIYCGSDPGVTVATGDWVTFRDWGATTDAERQERYAHWTDSNLVLGTVDGVKRYV